MNRSVAFVGSALALAVIAGLLSHHDSEAHTYWVLTTRTEAMRFRSGGCYDPGPMWERFTRVEAPQRPRN
jgi:hypothetical protein